MNKRYAAFFKVNYVFELFLNIALCYSVPDFSTGSLKVRPVPAWKKVDDQSVRNTGSLQVESDCKYFFAF